MTSLNELFHALSDPTRREILRMLRQHDMTAGEIAAAFPLADSTMSGHFRVLKYADLVVTERQGTKIVYSLNISAFDEGLIVVLDLVETVKQRKGKKP